MKETSTHSSAGEHVVSGHPITFLVQAIHRHRWLVILCTVLFWGSGTAYSTDVGGYIYCDKNNSNSYNSGESVNVKGLVVKVYNSSTNALLKTVTSDITGFYLAEPIANGTPVRAEVVYNGTTYSATGTSPLSTLHIKVNCTATSCSCTSLNLVSNGSFSNSTTGWILPASGSNFTFTGQYSYNNGPTLVINNNDSNGTYEVYQDVSVTAGKEYSITMKASTHNPYTAQNGNNHTVGYEFYNASNVKIGNRIEQRVTQSVFSSNPTYGTYSFIDTAPAGAVKMRIIGYALNDALKLDEVQVTTCVTPPTVSVSNNGPLGCNKSSVQVTATTNITSGATFTWTVPNGVTNPGNVASFNTSTAGNYSVVVTVQGVGSACSATASTTVQLVTKPNAGSDQSLCMPSPTTSLTGFTPAGGTWSAQSGNPAAATVTNAGAVSGMTVAGTYRFIYTLNGCADTVAVVLKAKPNAGADQSLCAPATTATLTGFTPAGGTWSAQSGNPASATVTNAGAVSGMSAVGTYRFIYTVNGCADTVAVVLKAKPNAGSDQSLCMPSPTTSLTGFTPAGGTWSAQSGNPASATVTNAGAVSGMTVAGTYRFIYTLNGCADTVAVVLKAKPNAGADKSLPCANPTTNTLQTTTTLTGFSPAGGTWSAQSGNPAAATVTNAGAVSGMTVAGTYRFIYTVNGCADTVAIAVESCPVCVKPNAGSDLSICAPLSGVSLSGFSPAGGTWTPQSGNPANASITNAGVITGMTANGSYRFIYSVTSGGQTCSDTVVVLRKSVTVSVTGPTDVCASDLPVNFTATPAGGSFTLPNNLPSGAVTVNANVLTLNPGSNLSSLTFSYSVTVDGCQGSATHTVNINTGGTPVNITPNSLCANQTSTYTDPSGTNGTWSGPGITDTGSGASLSAAAALTQLGTSAPASFYVYYAQSSGSCSRRDSALVTIKPQPTVSISGPTTLCASDLPVVYTATPSGGTFSLPGGLPAGAVTQSGNSLTLNPGFNLASLSFSYSYTDGTTGCTASAQKSVTITPKPNAGTDQSLCMPASTTTLTGFSPSGGTWSAQSGNPASATVTNAGAVSGMSVAGTYRFIYTVNGCADTVAVVLKAKPNAGTDQTLCLPALTTTLTGFSPAGGSWSAQSGNPASATVTNAGAVSGMSVAGTYRFVYTVNGCADTVAVVLKAKPNAGTDQTLACVDPVSNTLQTTTTLTGFSPAGGTWSAQSGNPATATVTNAGAVSGMSVAGTYRFIYTVNGCADTVAVTVQACAGCTKPDAGSDLSICAPASTATLTGFSPAGGTWTAQSGNPAAATVTNAGAVSGMSVAGTYRFIYTVTSGGETCSDTVAVTVNPKPNAGTDQTLACVDPVSNTLQTTTTLTGFSPAGGTWSAQSGNPAAATVTNAGAVSGMSVAGTYRFIYTVNGCADTVAVTVQACAGCTKPDAGSDLSICAPASTAMLTGFSPAGGTWSAQSGNPAAAAVTNAGAVSGMSVAGTYRFIYTVTSGGETCSDTVAVTVNPKPNAGTDQTLACVDPVSNTLQTTTTLTGFSPAGGTWSAQSGNPATATVTNAGAVSGMSVAGTYRFIYTVNGCADTVTVTVQACAGCTKPDAGSDLSICAPASTATLTGFSPVGGTWSAQSGNPAAATVTNAGAVSGMSVAGTYRFIYTVTSGGETCSDTVAVTVNPKPNAGTDQTLACVDPVSNTLQTTATLTGFSPAGGTWSAQSGNPAAATVTNAGAVSGMSVAGTYRFIYTVNGCADTVAVTVQACAGCTKPDAGPDQTALCMPTSSTTLAGFSPAGGTWSAQSGNPATATVTNAGAVSGMSVAGTYRFIYTVTSGGETCSDTVAVTVNPKPNAGTDQTLCMPALTTTLTGFSPAGGSWSAQSGNPAAATVTNAGAVSGMSVAGTYRFIYTVNGCADTVGVVLKAKPNAGTDQTLACVDPVSNTLQTTTTLTGFSPAGGTWSAQSGNPAAATVTNAGVVSGMSVAGTYRFIYTVNGCADTVAVTVQACAGCTKPDAGSDLSICAPASTATLTGFSPAGGTWSAQIGNPAAATVTNAGAVSGMSVAGTYRFIYTVTSGGETCSDTVAVVLKAKPNAGTDQTLCMPALTTTLTGFSPTGGSWSAQSGNPASATVTNAGAVSGMSVAGTYRFIYTVNGCADTVAVVLIAKPNAGTDQTLACVDPVSNTLQTTTTLTGFSPAGGSWSAQSGNPASATVTNVGAVSGMSVAGTYRFIYTVNGCADTVAVTVQACAGCTKPDAGPDQTALCMPTSSTTLAGFSPAGGTWSAQSGNPASATVTNAGAVSGMSVAGTYRFIYTVTSGGETCSDTVAVTVNPKPNAGTDQTLCMPALTTTLTGFSPAGGTWSAQSGNPASATVTNAGAVSGMSAAGTYRFIYTVNGCADTVAVVLKAKPNAGTDQTLACVDPVSNTLQTTTTLTGFSPAGGSWSAQSGNPAAATVTNAGAVSGMSVAGTYRFIYTVNGCADTVAVIVQACAGCTKPDAGSDLTLTCPPSGIAPTTATLSGLPAGGTWSAQSGNPAAATVTNAGAVSGMSVAGTYRFIYTVTSGGETCSDTVAVTVPVCEVPKGSIGDFVWKDLNDNGQQDSGEPGVNGVKVILWSAVGGNPSAKLDSTTTAGNGAYSFTNLPAGDYIVQIDVATLPDSCLISSKQNVGDDATDNDFSPAGLSPVVTLDPTQSGLTKDNPTIDAALYSPKGSLGDFVWKDLNDNGQQDSGEPGVNGVKVILWSAVGGNPSAKLDSMLTAGNGAYSFTNLPAGDYIVQIDVATLPDSCLISSKQNVGDDATDNDFSPAGLSPVVTIDPTGSGLAKNNPTIDAALYAPCVLPVYGTITPSAASCNGQAPNNDASFSIAGISGATRYTYATTLAGLAAYTAATPLVGTSLTVTNLPNPASPSGQNYIVRIFNGKDDCFMDINVLIPYRDCSDVCVKPDAGPSQVFVCKPAASVDLPDAASGQQWISDVINPVGVTIQSQTGLVNGLTESGVYMFILRDAGIGSTCSDTVFVFRGVLELPDQSTCFDTLTLPTVAGATWTAVAGTGASITPNGQISGMSTVGTIYRFVVSNEQCRDTVEVERLNCNKTYDLALDKSISKKLAMLGDTLTYTIRVWNEGEATAHGIVVTDVLNAGVQYVSSSAGMGSYSPMSKTWSFDSLTVGDTVSLAIRVRVVAQGVWFNTAEITSMTEEDVDSTPGNGVETEDDIDRECFTVPILLCRGQGGGLEMNVPDTYTGVVWFRKVQGGQPVQVGTGNTYTATETELGSYEYSFTTSSGSCPAEGCCPVLIVVEDCCPAQVCVPVLITKKRASK